jgi:O-antigen/teichoic acid export membrane protein
VSTATLAPSKEMNNKSPVVKHATALMVSTVVSAALGFAFWLVAARWFPASTVGAGSALVSSMTLLASIAQLNLASLYARFVPTAGHRTRALLLAGAGASVITGVVATLGWIAFGRNTGGSPLLFGVSVVFSALYFITDGALNALGRATLVPLKAVVASAGKVGLLVAFAFTGANLTGDGLLLLWTVPVVLTVIVTTWITLRRLIPSHVTATVDVHEPIDRAEVVRFASAEYVNAIVFNVVAFLPPVLVTSVVGPEQGAYFYLPWLFGVSATTMLWNIVTSFVATASRDADAGAVWSHLTRSMKLGAAVALPGALVLILGAEPLLSILGPGYAEHGATALRVIGAAIPFTGVLLLYAALRFMRKQLWPLTALQSVGGLVFLVSSWFGVHHYGLVAPAWAYLITQAALAVIVTPTLVRHLHHYREAAALTSRR